MTRGERQAIENLDHLSEDNREICFEQGKPCVYEPEAEPGVVVAEWPNGTRDRLDLEAQSETRTWAGRVSGKSSHQQARRVPSLAAKQGERIAVPRLTIVIGANGAGKST